MTHRASFLENTCDVVCACVISNVQVWHAVSATTAGLSVELPILFKSVQVVRYLSSAFRSGKLVGKRRASVTLQFIAMCGRALSLSGQSPVAQTLYIPKS